MTTTERTIKMVVTLRWIFGVISILFLIVTIFS